MKTQKEVKRIEDKGAVILENRRIVMNRMLLERNMNLLKVILVRFLVTSGNVTRNWKESDPCYKMVEKLVE